VSLIENLAEQACCEIAAAAPFYHKESLEAAYVAGFRAARDLASRYATSSTEKPHANEDAHINVVKFLSLLKDMGE
jgi:hypothetical protein